LRSRDRESVKRVGTRDGEDGEEEGRRMGMEVSANEGVGARSYMTVSG